MVTEINQAFLISITLDKRRPNTDNTYPVRIRIYTQKDSKRKLIPTNYNFTQDEFEQIWPTQPNKKTKYYKVWEKLRDLESSARDLAKTIIPFSLSKFESLIKGEDTLETPTKTINYYFGQKIKHHLIREAISTATGYRLTLKSLQKFSLKIELEFEDITVKFLEEYERHCIRKEEKSITTVGIYLRNLRAVFNDAKITGDKYPFGRGKYVIKSPKKIKKALDSSILKLLFEGCPSNEEQAKAKAFWFFSYLGNGMNIKDILNLQVKDLRDGKITFLRAKTSMNSSQPEPITVYLSEYAKEVIEKYGNKEAGMNDYLFNILSNTQSAQEQHRTKQNFIRSVNQNFLRYAQRLGINQKVSTYYARHSFSTHLIRKGVSIEAVGEALGHSNIKTTMHYFAGFEDESKKEVAKKLLDFE